MLLVKNGTVAIHLKLDTWKEPGQKKHIKDPAKRDFKRYSTDVSFWETACPMPELSLENLRAVSPQIVFIMNSRRFTWQRFPVY